MKRGAFLALCLPAIAVPLLFAREAAADALQPGSGSAGQITDVSAGVSELSLESIFVLGYDERGDINGDIKNFRSSVLVGPSFRYFIANNAVLGFNVSFLYKDANGQVSSSDLGGSLNVSIGYLLALSGGMFLKPLVGVGGLYAQRSEPVLIDGREEKASPSVWGGIVRPGLDLVFYSSSRFNLFAGPEFIVSFGESTSTQVGNTKIDGAFFLSIDGGFNVGLSYVF
jgi:hypothetical protein